MASTGGGRVRRRTVLGFAALAAAGFGASAALAGPPAVFEGRPTLVIVYETTPNPPRHLGVGTAIDWDRPGLTVELLKRVGERLQVNLAFKRVPWKRGLLMLETGEADGIFHSSYVAERESIGVYPKTAAGRPDQGRALFSQSYSLFVTRGSTVTWDGTAIGGLAGRPVGATAGYSVIADLERLGVPVEPGRAPELNLAKLAQGRLAACAELENLAGEIIRRDPVQYASVVKLEPPLVTKPYYLMLSRQFLMRDPGLANAVWSAIPEVRASRGFRELETLYADGG